MEIKPIFSKEAEEAVIGSILINPESFKKIDLSADDFYLATNKDIWRAFQEISLSGGMIDIVTLAEKLGNRTDTVKFIENVPSSLHVAHYAEIVREKARRRDLVLLASEMAKTAYDQNEDLEKEIPGYMTRLISGAKIAAGAEHISGVLAKLYDEIKERSENPADVWGLSTGFTDFDLMTGGLHTGEMTLLSGKPGLGKSIICMQMAMGMCKESPGVIYEMEMGAVQTVRRSVSNESRIETRKMRNGKVASEDWKTLMAAIEAIEKLPIYISDNTGWTTASMRADLARLKALYDVKWFVVDYLYLLQDQYGRDDHERLSYISKSLKGICKELDMAGLVIHSMTKSEMNSDNPSIAGMRGSGQIGYDADVAIYLLEDENNDKNVRLHFVKFREDIPDRYVSLTRDNGFPAFKNIVREQPTYRSQYKD